MIWRAATRWPSRWRVGLAVGNVNGQINPYLMTLACQMGDTDRKRMRPYLTTSFGRRCGAGGYHAVVG